MDFPDIALLEISIEFAKTGPATWTIRAGRRYWLSARYRR
jgi:hypothetical protein